MPSTGAIKNLSKGEKLTAMKLRFPLRDLLHWSKEYSYSKPDLENKIIEIISPAVKQRGYLNREEFLLVCNWKTSRSKSRCAQNDKNYIKDITSVALSTSNERLAIEILTLLEGVRFPTASVILHFFHEDKYPIIDFRALWSLGIENPPTPYSFDIWNKYVYYCRGLSEQSELDMRTIDKALWAFSDKNQK